MLTDDPRATLDALDALAMALTDGRPFLRPYLTGEALDGEADDLPPEAALLVLVEKTLTDTITRRIVAYSRADLRRHGLPRAALVQRAMEKESHRRLN